MTVKERYLSAKEMYDSLGVDTEKAISALQNFSISMHCWQGDDVKGFDQDGPLSGGIQTTGNYPGRARTRKTENCPCGTALLARRRCARI